MESAITRSSVVERELLEAARAGDDDAFGLLVAPYRGELHAHCYRMLGSVHDAEDALQDALLRAWRGLPRFAGRSSLRTWLYRIMTNACVDAIGRRSRRVLPVDYGPPAAPGEDPGDALAESVWIEPYPDELLADRTGLAAPEAHYEQREAVELAFIAALQHLPARQRAVLVLREVLGFSAREAAGMLDTTVASVNSALQRARKTLEERLPDESQQATMRALGEAAARDLVERFVTAMETGDVDALLRLLTQDATFAMPPYAEWYRDRDAIADSWLMPGGPPSGLRLLPTRASGQLAVGAYVLSRDESCFLPLALDVLTLDGGRIGAITAYRMPSLFPRFGLPERVAA